MEIIELGLQVFPHAHELPNKNRRWVNGTNKSSSSNSGGGKHGDRMAIPGKMHAELQLAAQRQTEANRRMLVLNGTGKRRWVRIADWNHEAA